MKLISKVFRPGGSTHVLDGKQYHFREEKPAEGSKHDNPDIPHVCEVKDTNAIERFLETGGFKIYGEDSQEPAVVTKPTSAGAVASTDEIDPVKVAEIRELSITALKENIATYRDVDLTAALKDEQADEKPRKGFIDALEAHLTPAP